MTSLTLSLSEELRNKIKELIWINWSEIAREEATKKVIFENYMKTRELTDEEWKFCEKIDWHPVDELPLKEEFVKKLNKIKYEKRTAFKDISELRKIIEK